MNISEEYKKILQEKFGNNVTFKENRIITNILSGREIIDRVVVPNKMYPLEGADDVEIFTEYNTERVNDSIIEDIYNATEYKVGRCYTNSENLLNNFHKAGITDDVAAYVGWFFVTSFKYPVHHCAVLYKKKHLLDLSAHIIDDDLKGLSVGRTTEELREIMSNRFVSDIKSKKQSERTYFGGMMPSSLFIAKKLSPADGSKLYNELMKIYPNHPTAQNLQSNNFSKMQNIMYSKLKED